MRETRAAPRLHRRYGSRAPPISSTSSVALCARSAAPLNATRTPRTHTYYKYFAVDDSRDNGNSILFFRAFIPFSINLIFFFFVPFFSPPVLPEYYALGRKRRSCRIHTARRDSCGRRDTPQPPIAANTPTQADMDLLFACVHGKRFVVTFNC